MARRPNLLYVMADEWRAAAVGAVDADPVSTPHIDRLARDGVLLTDAVSTDPVCSPHRAMLLTGQYAPTNGVTANCNSATAPMQLSATATCWPDVLNAAGYQCAYLGKWHLDAPTEADARYGHGPRRDGRVSTSRWRTAASARSPSCSWRSPRSSVRTGR